MYVLGSAASLAAPEKGLSLKSAHATCLDPEKYWSVARPGCWALRLSARQAALNGKRSPARAQSSRYIFVMRVHLGCNLVVGHFVSRFNTDDTFAQAPGLKPLLKLTACFARPKNQNGFCAV